MISYRHADLLERTQRPLVQVTVDLCIPADETGTRPLRSDGKMYATLGIERNSYGEEILSLFEEAIGHRISDRIYSKEGESFVNFGNRLRFTLEKDLQKIASTPIKVEKDPTLGTCCFSFKFGMRMK